MIAVLLMALGATEPPPLVQARERAPRGALEIDASEPGAQIWLDGRDTGLTTPAMIDELLQGQYEVEVRLEARRGSALATVQPGKTVGVHVRFGTTWNNAGVLQNVRVETEPPGAAIALDGLARGASPVELLVSAGDHRLVAEMRGRQTQAARVVPSTDHLLLALQPDDIAITWSILWPQFELARRLAEGVWLGARLAGLSLQLVPGACNAAAAEYISGSVLIHRHFEPPEAFWGWEIYGGPIASWLNWSGPGCRGGVEDALLGAVIGFGGRAGPFMIELEAHAGLLHDQIRGVILPQLAVRHTL